MKPRRLFLSSVFSLAAATGLFAPVVSAQTIGPEVVLRDLGIPEDISLYSAAYEPGATYLAWRDTRNLATTGGDIYVQKLGLNGEPLWAVNGLAVCRWNGNQRFPSITPDGAGGAVVAWLDPWEGGNEAVAAQRVSASGAIQWTEDGTLVGFVSGQSPRPFVHRVSGNLNTFGEFAVTWGDSATVNGSLLHLHAAAFLNGTTGLRYAPTALISYAGIMRARSVSDGSGGAILFGKIRENGGFRFKNLPAVQTTVWPAPIDFVTVVDDAAPFFYDADGVGGVVLAYQTPTSIRAIRVAADSTRPWGLLGTGVDVVTSNLDTTQDFAVAGDGQGGAFIAWISSSPRNVRVQHYSATGTATWAAGGVALPDTSDAETEPAIVADGAGGAYVSYRTGTVVRGQRLNSSGVAQWSSGNDGLNLGVGDGPLIGAGTGGAVVINRITVNSVNGLAGRKIYAETTALASRLVNISTRAVVGTGADILVPGFVIVGTGNKDVLIRAAGPVLGGAPFNIPGVLADPVLTLFNNLGQSISSNDDWQQASNLSQLTTIAGQVGAFNFPGGGKDAAILANLAPGLYTASVAGVGAGTGVALVEVYDAGGSTSRAVNISCRAMVGTGGNTVIPGFVVEGNTTKTLLIRGVGPTLGGTPFNVPGVLADPVLTLFNSGGVAIASNNDWEVGNNGTVIAQVAQNVQAFALTAGSKDSVLLVTLGPGLYTVQLSGAGGTTGVALVELYDAS